MIYYSIHVIPIVIREIQVLHFSHTDAMFKRLTHELGKIWGNNDLELNRKLWNVYMVDPWDCWHLNVHPSVPLAIASNNVIEGWHEHGVKRVVGSSGDFKGTTEVVLTITLPRIAYLDGVVMADALNFTLQMDWLGRPLYEAAAKIVQDNRRYRVVFPSDDTGDVDTAFAMDEEEHFWEGKKTCIIYVLSNHSSFKKLDDALISK